MIWDGVMIVLLIIILLLLIRVFIEFVWVPFSEERLFIKMEIKRTEGEERHFWKKELRRLYIRSIPIIGNLYNKKHKE